MALIRALLHNAHIKEILKNQLNQRLQDNLRNHRLVREASGSQCAPLESPVLLTIILPNPIK